ncbi:MAG: T9SS type A sorting domain-containing protein [Saprospiraceae bacterium]|nr:T9SS type A sorting domain-containing protein [Saprospiraceae bacterium]
MNLRQNIIAVSFVGSIYFLLANAGGVPQAVTKAPGEASHNSCATCHTPAGNYVPAVALDIMNKDSVKVNTYTPGETYIVRLRVSATNSPKAFGFQMACLDSLTNSDLGVWSAFGDKVKQQQLTVQQKPRKYLVQSAAKTNGIFTANWKAPSSDMGKVKFYFTGLAINQNGNTNGDNNVFSQLTLKGPSTTSLEELEWTTDVYLYPNPCQDFITLTNESVSLVTLIGLSGSFSYKINPQDKNLNTSTLTKGLYIAVLKDNSGNILKVQKVIKQ